MDPTVFSIAGDKTYRTNESEELVRRLLQFVFHPPALSYPFMVFPGQISGLSLTSYLVEKVWELRDSGTRNGKHR